MPDETHHLTPMKLNTFSFPVGVHFSTLEERPSLLDLDLLCLDQRLITDCRMEKEHVFEDVMKEAALVRWSCGD